MDNFVELSDEEISEIGGGFVVSEPIFDKRVIDINPPIKLKKRFPWIFR